MSDPTNIPKTFPLMELPQSILRYFLKGILKTSIPISNPWRSEFHTKSPQESWRRDLNVQILATCKHLNHIGTSILYQENIFRFTMNLTKDFASTKDDMEVERFFNRPHCYGAARLPGHLTARGRLIRRVIIDYYDPNNPHRFLENRPADKELNDSAVWWQCYILAELSRLGAKLDFLSLILHADLQSTSDYLYVIAKHGVFDDGWNRVRDAGMKVTRLMVRGASDKGRYITEQGRKRVTSKNDSEQSYDIKILLNTLEFLFTECRVNVGKFAFSSELSVRFDIENDDSVEELEEQPRLEDMMDDLTVASHFSSSVSDLPEDDEEREQLQRALELSLQEAGPGYEEICDADDEDDGLYDA